MPSLSLAFVLRSVPAAATHDDDVMELLLYAGARIEQHLVEHPAQPLTVTVLVSDSANDDGWAEVRAAISPLALPFCRLAVIPQPVVPCIGEARLQETYQLLEHLKTQAFDEVHHLDHGGVGFFATQAKHLGLAFLESAFVVHIVGGAVFRTVADDSSLSLASLVDDLLERGSVTRSNDVLVHDRRAWDWYAGKIEPRDEEFVRFLGVPLPVVDSTLPDEPADGAFSCGNARSPFFAFYGPLSTSGALPLFSDAMDHLSTDVPQTAQPPGMVHIVGPPGAVGGIDAASYVRIRQPQWKRSVEIRIDMSIADEIALLRDEATVVVIDPRRRDSLRIRLLQACHPCVVTIGSGIGAGPDETSTPAALSAAMTRPMPAPTGGPTEPVDLLDLWRRVHVVPPARERAPAAVLDCVTEGPLVSICVTHHERPNKLRTALRSLESQTYRNIEVIVVDDGSRDPAVHAELDLIEQEIAPLGWKVIRQANRYLGAARNMAAHQARGELLLFMDDDNAAKPQEVETLVSVQRRTGADVVTCFCDVFEDDAELTSEVPPTQRFTPMGSDVALGLLNNCFGDANALWSRPSFERLGGFTEDWGITHEDWELFCRAALEGMTLILVPEPLFWYRIDAAGMSRGPRKQVLELANRHRHLRPYVEKLPYELSKLAQLAQALAMPVPTTVVGERTRSAPVLTERPRRTKLPFARVAVVMRTKDRPLLLRRAVESVVSQTYGDWLLIVVNDGGDPEMVELVLASFEERLRDRILVIHHPFSVGMQTASNAALACSASEFVVIHDDDDSWRPTFLARTVTHLDDNGWRPSSGAVVTWSTLVTEKVEAERGEIVTMSRQLFNQIGSIGLVDMSIENRFPPIAFVFRRVVLEAVGPFDENHGPLGDWDFNLRVLAQFDIDVIAEPLANYHHRPVASVGNYGNSVHAQEAAHRAKRVDLVNGVLRSRPDWTGAPGLAHAVVAGEFHHQAMVEQQREFRRLHDGLWNLEQRIVQLNRKLDPERRGRNLIRNGDFRDGCRPIDDVRPPGAAWAYRELTPGVTLSYDGVQVVYRAEVRTAEDASGPLPIGKSYLRIEKDAGARQATWFVLQLHVPTELLADQPVCISGRGRLDAPSGWLEVSGLLDTNAGEHVPWATNQIWLGEEFTRFATVFPALSSSSRLDGTTAVGRVMVRLPYQAAFILEITDLQLEVGSVASEFEYRGADVGTVNGHRLLRGARSLRNWRSRSR